MSIFSRNTRSASVESDHAAAPAMSSAEARQIVARADYAAELGNHATGGQDEATVARARQVLAESDRRAGAGAGGFTVLDSWNSQVNELRMDMPPILAVRELAKAQVLREHLDSCATGPGGCQHCSAALDPGDEVLRRQEAARAVLAERARIADGVRRGEAEEREFRSGGQRPTREPWGCNARGGEGSAAVGLDQARASMHSYRGERDRAETDPGARQHRDHDDTRADGEAAGDEF